MESIPIYIPVFRLRQQEQKVLTTFDFGKHIYPYVEIIKEYDMARVQSKKLKKDGTMPKAPKSKTFEEIHLPVIAAIKSKKVFVDLPAHFIERKDTQPAVISFMTSIVNKRELRTSFMKKFNVLSDKVIPVISTYFHKTNELNTIVSQANDLRPTYSTLCFRTCLSSYKNDILQIKKVFQSQDFILLDLENCEVDINDPEIEEMINVLSDFDKSHFFLIRSALDKNMTNIGMKHGEIIDTADNSLVVQFRQLGAVGFGDYAGVKRDDLADGGTVSPGFVFYDVTTNNFYGFRGSKKPAIEDFENIIIPAVLSSEAVTRMNNSGREYLCEKNKGWSMLNGMDTHLESSKNQAKFKRVSMEHYLHCIRTIIEDGDLT
ncbi:MAG TPA: hypothetical protein VL125_04885 [Pelobium sp.]|nr:hypothetical protein [Pelobium sp.]